MAPAQKPVEKRRRAATLTTKPTKRVRCAVYTRVSTEYGLDQEFNSLDAQHEAAEAYIRSQTHDGWTLIRTRYDDGGYSGGFDRPPGAAAAAGGPPGAQDRYCRGLQGRPPDPLARGTSPSWSSCSTSIPSHSCP